jgi:ABC-type phosphate/phosphonate transport system substrate-binding protein
MNKAGETSLLSSISYQAKNDFMKKIFACSALVFILFACSNASNDNEQGASDTTNSVDTSAIGSDNPNHVPDTTGSITDSLKNQIKKKPRFQ